MDEQRKIVSKRIEKARKHLGMTQEQFAVALGMEGKRGRSMVNNWEQGVVHVKSDDLWRIGSLLGISTNFLLGFSECMSINDNMEIAVKTTGLSEKAIESLKENDISVISLLLESALFYRLIDAINGALTVSTEIRNGIENKSLTKEKLFCLLREYRYSRFDISESMLEIFDKIDKYSDHIEGMQMALNSMGEAGNDGEH